MNNHIAIFSSKDATTMSNRLTTSITIMLLISKPTTQPHGYHNQVHVHNHLTQSHALKPITYSAFLTNHMPDYIASPKATQHYSLATDIWLIYHNALHMLTTTNSSQHPQQVTVPLRHFLFVLLFPFNSLSKRRDTGLFYVLNDVPVLAIHSPLPHNHCCWFIFSWYFPSPDSLSPLPCHMFSILSWHGRHHTNWQFSHCKAFL